MNKTTKIVIAAVAVIAVVAIVVVIMLNNSKPKTNLEPITSGEDLTALVEKIYEGLEVERPMVESKIIDITKDDEVKAATGLDNADDLEYVVESLPVMMAQPYSLVLAKIKDGVNIEEVAKEMNENIDARKWVCVSAEKVYTTTSGDVICLVMSRDEVAKPVYEKFKTLAGTIGKEYERTEEDGQLPEDMLPAYDGEVVEDNVPAEDTLPAVDPVE